MKTFNWVEVDKADLPNDITVLFCYYTQENKNFNTRRHSCLMAYVLKDKIEQHKKYVEEDRRCAVRGGAWEPIEDAMWHFNGNNWVIDESQIRVVA